MPEPCGQIAAAVYWAVDDLGVLIVRQGSPQAHRIAHPQAAVWDLLQRGYERQRLVPMLAAIIRADTAEAEALLNRCLQDWALLGLLASGKPRSAR